MAAALIEDVEQDQARAVVGGLCLPGQKKLHWTHEDDKRRAAVAEAIGRVPALHLLVVASTRPRSPNDAAGSA